MPPPKGRPGQVWPPPWTTYRITPALAAPASYSLRITLHLSLDVGSSVVLGSAAQPLHLTQMAMQASTDRNFMKAATFGLGPSNGTRLSTVPWMCKTGTGYLGSYLSRARVPETGAMAAMRSESSAARR